MLVVREVFGSVFVNRQTSFLSGTFGGRLEFPSVGTNVFFAINEATIANDNRVVLYVWYDNEFGYSCQVVRVMEEMAGIKRPSFPATDVVKEAMSIFPHGSPYGRIAGM